MSVRVTQIGVGGFDENFSYIIHDEASRMGYVVDPSGNFSRIIHAITVLKLQIVGILVTHTHHDHFDALPLALDAYPVPVFVHENGKTRLSAEQVEPLSDQQVIKLGDQSIKVIATPGHINDAVCFYIEAHDTVSPQLITGDTLFVDGCGRTSEADAQDLFSSLQVLKQLPPQTIIFPGHDYGPTPTATLQNQLNSNQYLNTDSYEVFHDRRLPQNKVQ